MLVIPPAVSVETSATHQSRALLFLSVFTPKTFVFVALVIIGLASVGGGVWWLWQGSSQMCVTQEISSDVSTPPATYSAQVSRLYVDISGAITKPGIYELTAGARLATLVEEAGGFSKDADTQYISQELNLATLLKDGDKVYIYTQQEARQRSQLSSQNTIGAESSTTVSTLTNTVSLNNGSQKELEGLPGIGEKRASDIVAGRPYSSVTELVERKLVSDSIFTEISPFLTL